MAASRPRPGNSERGWNDPPMFGFSATQQQGSPRRLLNKRVAYPATCLPPPGHAVLTPGQGPPLGNTSGQEASPGIPIPKVIQGPQVGNSALPPALQVVTTAVPGQDAPISPVLLPPSADASMPVTVPLLVPTIVKPVKPQSDQNQNPAFQDERLADLLSRLQLQDDDQLLHHVMGDFNTVMDRHCKMLTEKACEDIRKKLEMFEDRWKKGHLSEPVKTKITHLATALINEEIDKANHLHLALMVDHIAEVNQWMMGVKRLIQQQQLFIKERNISAENTNTCISGEQNSAVETFQGTDPNICDNIDTASGTVSDINDGACDNIVTAVGTVGVVDEGISSTETIDNQGQQGENELKTDSVIEDMKMTETEANDTSKASDKKSKNEDLSKGPGNEGEINS